MKSRHIVILLAFMLFVALGLGGCASQVSQTPAPAAPSLQVPGETVADDQLVLDTIKTISYYSLGKHKCPYISVVDTKRIKTEGVIEDDSKGRIISGDVFEEWTVDQCGNIETYQVTYKPDGKGGTFVNVRPAE